MSTRAGAASDNRERAYRWLAATRRLTPSGPVAGADRRCQQGAAQSRLCALAAAMLDEPRARGHAERVSALSRRLALAIGLTPDEAEVVALAGLLHDIGLLGATPTGDAADAVHRRHPLIGAQLVAPFDLLGLAAPMIRHHHERLDGSGYPDGLRGDAIPVGGRIIAVADEYDRLTTAADTLVPAHDDISAHRVGRARQTLDGSVLSALLGLPLP